MSRIIESLPELTRTVEAWRAKGGRIGLVPTMGALHEGHLALARRARAECDHVLVSVFVNPKQLNNANDLETYPRSLDQDARLLASVGVDAIFAPDVAEIYPKGFATSITVGGVSEPLEGAMRPGHFDGVATVVTKLFGMSQAHCAYFGEKDWQQLQVVRRLVADLNLPIEIIGCETVRDADGLALSSRNQRLTPQGRATAPALYRQMTEAARELAAGGAVDQVLDKAREALIRAGFERVEYLELRQAASLAPAGPSDPDRRLLAAVWLDGVRLIDNIAV